MKLAAIDIGSNSIKLAVVDAAASDSFAVLAREKETVRLGHQTLREEFLSPAAIERAVDFIGRLRSIAEARGAEQALRLRLTCEGGCDREEAAAESKSDLFTEVFGCGLALSVHRPEPGPEEENGEGERSRRARLRV